MSESLIVSFMGDDRPGIVQKLADVVAKRGGSWQESRMSALGGYFSGTARILIETEGLEGLNEDLRALEELTFIIRPLRQQSSGQVSRRMKLDLVGPDRPGILQDVMNQLVGYGINVVEMETAVGPAPMSGELTFSADALVEVPEGVDIELLDRQLDAVATSIGIDILFDEFPED